MESFDTRLESDYDASEKELPDKTFENNSAWSIPPVMSMPVKQRRIPKNTENSMSDVIVRNSTENLKY